MADKWRKCLRRIPLRPKSAQDNIELPTDEKEHDEVKSRRRSPRLLPHQPLQQNQNVIPELSEEEIKKREAQREERRRQFEEQVKWEAEAKENVKLSIDDRLREVLEHESDNDVFDAPSPGPDEEYDFPFEGGPKTPPREPDIPVVRNYFKFFKSSNLAPKLFFILIYSI